MKRFFKKHWKKLVLVLVIVGVLTAGWFYGVKPLIAKIKGAVINPEDVVTVKKDKVEVLFTGSGTVTAKQDIKVTSKPSGILKAVYVKEGDYVKKGQAVGLIKPGRNEFEDYKPMPIYTEASGTVVKCVGRGDYEKPLSDKDLSLPRLGIFLEGSYDSAENATCFLRVVNMDSLLISTYVTEAQVMKLKPGMPVEITIRSLGENAPKLEGKISHVSSQSEATDWSGSSGFLVVTEIDNSDKKILLGVTAEMKVAIDKKEDVLTIPANALFEKDGKNYAFKVVGKNKTKKVEIEIGLTSDKNVEVTKGLAENDQVLTTLPYGESW
ncbi:MAG: HlyD family efflux transporter periplasmic adaptor subunit [Elusimicrobiaceae bacterium]|nr:HlyD family efflux transporter periplasmic adaptor subunit [Elusimicrobiaceae bacterium]